MPSILPHIRPTIGVLAGWQYYVTAVRSNYLSPVYSGIRRAAADLDCNLLLACGLSRLPATLEDPMRPAWPVLSSETDFVPIGPWNADALIIINPLHTSMRSRYIRDLMAAGHPVMFIASGEPGPTVTTDNAAGIRAAMQHLVGHGHRRIAFIAGVPVDLAGDTGERLQAYRAALQEHGLPADERLIAWGQHTYDGGYAALRQLLATNVSFTAVLGSNDESALGAMRALKEAGLRIPEDVAVIGFDDCPESAVHEPTLTSLAASTFQMGYCALEQLLQQIRGQPLPDEPIRFAPRLVLRESCGCGRAGAHGALAAAPASAQPDPVPEDWRRRLTEALLTAFERNDPEMLAGAIASILRQAPQDQEEITALQAVFSVMRDDWPALMKRGSKGTSHNRMNEFLQQAWAAIAAGIWRQQRKQVVDEHRTAAYVGLLTAHLQSVLDEAEVYEVLARYLPEMGVHFAAAVTFEPEDEDPVAWGQLHLITPNGATIRFPCRQFPPAGMFPIDQPFSLALLPLAGPRGQLGFAALDSSQLDSYLAIVQQMAAALNTAQLYREAIESRRLAEEAYQMKSRFLSTVSHELRTPLNLIVGLGEILLQDSERGDTPLPPAALKDIERLNANAQHLGRLINDVLDLASSDAGQLRLTRQLVDLSRALRPVAETGRRLAAAKGLAWRASLPESGPWVWGDRMRLAQVALNLISNAVKYTTQGEVALRLESDVHAKSVTITVQDTGLGIPAEEQNTIFDEFRRSERSVARGYGGLGLGLAICKRLIELHGGTIGVRSTGQEGAGSAFYFTLPVVEPPAACGGSAAHAGKPETAGLLLLTPSLDTGERLHQHLAERGFTIQVCLMDRPSDWQSGMIVSPPSAVVLDVSSAADQAWHVLRTLKVNPAMKNLPVFFYSSSENSGAVLELDYLTKPIELAELTRALDQHWQATSGERTDRPRRTFLVVDDDPDTLDMHARIVQAHSPSHRVLKARNGREALERLLSEQVDLVLLDLMMPEMDGFGVLEAMRDRESTRNIPVIVVTGQTLSESDMARLNRGVAKVLSKGVFTLDELLAHLEATLAHKREVSGEAQRLVRQATAYLQERYAEPIAWQDVAQHVGLSEDYLASCFRKELGLTPAAYLNRYRIEQAKRLLKNTPKNITEIALETGFSGGSHFTRAFRRETGITPGAYRRK